LNEALREAGVPVVALAQSTTAVDVLREKAHITSAETVARFLKDERLQKSAGGGLVLVDEASLLGTRDMLKLFDLCQEVGAPQATRRSDNAGASAGKAASEDTSAQPVQEVPVHTVSLQERKRGSVR
jgi:hypothetical protein